ncbi:MAG TPA: cyclase family protein [Rhodoplanes sp.]|nr:cyclase family protein [Rhodoplanes sp.]
MCVPGCMDVVRDRLTRRGFFQGASFAAAGAAAVASLPGVVSAKPGPFTSVIDLTHTLSPDFPTFFGVPGIEMERRAELRKDGYNMYAWQLVEHTGTHLDAPIHFSETGASVDGIAAATLIAPLVVIDVSAKAEKDADYLLSRDDLAAWEGKHGTLPEGGCVAMHSGWGRLATDDPARFIGRDVDGTLHFPGIAPEATEWLLKERQIAGLAVDTLSLDHGPSRDFKTHHLWLPSGRWGLENVANLDRAPAAGATLVVGLPKVKDATGAPVRLFAFL